MSAYDPAVSALRGHVAELATALMVWATRDDTKAQPDVRRAANDAVDAIDAAVRELHGIRAQLVGEIRAADDAAMARSEELLGKFTRRLQEGDQ